MARPTPKWGYAGPAGERVDSETLGLSENFVETVCAAVSPTDAGLFLTELAFVLIGYREARDSPRPSVRDKRQAAVELCKGAEQLLDRLSGAAGGLTQHGDLRMKRPRLSDLRGLLSELSSECQNTIERIDKGHVIEIEESPRVELAGSILIQYRKHIGEPSYYCSRERPEYRSSFAKVLAACLEECGEAVRPSTLGDLIGKLRPPTF